MLYGAHTPRTRLLMFVTDDTIVSRVSATTPRFSRDTGRLPCLKIEIGGADCVGVATSKRVPHACMACNVVRALYRAHAHVSVPSVSELLLYKSTGKEKS